MGCVNHILLGLLVVVSLLVAPSQCGYASLVKQETDLGHIHDIVTLHRTMIKRFPECSGAIEYKCKESGRGCRGYGIENIQDIRKWSEVAQGQVVDEGTGKCPLVEEYRFLDGPTYAYYSDVLECRSYDGNVTLPFAVPEKITQEYLENHFHYYTVATNWHPFFAVLLRSAEKMGRRPEVLGADDDRFRKKYVGGVDSGMKIQHMRNTLRNLPDDDIVLFTDAYDVVFVREISGIVEEYLKFGVDIVISGEKNCYPDANRAPEYPLLENDQNPIYKYLNAGAYIGRAGALKWLFSSHYWRLRESDQRFWTSLYLRHHLLDCGPSIVIDTQARLFQSMNADGPEQVPFALGSFTNLQTQTSAYLLHFAGPYKQYIVPYYILTFYIEFTVMLCLLFVTLYGLYRMSFGKMTTTIKAKGY